MYMNSTLKLVFILALCAFSVTTATAKTKIEPLCFSSGGLGHPISDEKKQLMIVNAQIRESAWSAFKTEPKTTIEQDELLRSKFGNRKLSYVLTLRSNGSIENMQIRESSGIELNDRQAAETIRSAAPFRASQLKNQVYLVEFPEITVKLVPARVPTR